MKIQDLDDGDYTRKVIVDMYNKLENMVAPDTTSIDKVKKDITVIKMQLGKLKKKEATKKTTPKKEDKATVKKEDKPTTKEVKTKTVGK